MAWQQGPGTHGAELLGIPHTQEVLESHAVDMREIVQGPGKLPGSEWKQLSTQQFRVHQRHEGKSTACWAQACTAPRPLQSRHRNNPAPISGHVSKPHTEEALPAGPVRGIPEYMLHERSQTRRTALHGCPEGRAWNREAHRDRKRLVAAWGWVAWGCWPRAGVTLWGNYDF